MGTITLKLFDTKIILKTSSIHRDNSTIRKVSKAKLSKLPSVPFFRESQSTTICKKILLTIAHVHHIKSYSAYKYATFLFRIYRQAWRRWRWKCEAIFNHNVSFWPSTIYLHKNDCFCSGRWKLLGVHGTFSSRF